MCLGVPARIVEVRGDDPLTRTAKANCGGVIREISLAGCPNAHAGDYVVVHAGFAISQIDETEADHVFAYLREMASMRVREP